MILRISKGATINLTNYESARAEVTIEQEFAPIGPLQLLAEEDVKHAYDRLAGIINGLLQDEVTAIQSEAGLPPHNPKRFTG